MEGPDTETAPEAVSQDPVVGSTALRPLFLGNLNNDYAPEDVTATFEAPFQPERADGEPPFEPIPVDRIDVKRGYCFVFLKDAKNEADKERIEAYLKAIQGVNIPRVSIALRAEFARGDGRVKKKEDERRRNIAPSDTLFVVNFQEGTTRKEDLEMLFEPFGEIVRIDMKRNFAFVQFRTVEQASKAKDATNGGKLDQAVLTVEFVARESSRGGGGGDRRGGGGGGRDNRDGRRRRDDRDRRGPPPPPRRGGPYDGGRDRYYDDSRRSRSPPPMYRNDRPRPRSRSRSPPRYDRARGSRSPPRYDDRDRDYPPRYDDRDYRDRRSRSPEGYRGRSPNRDAYYDRERGGGGRGYRP